MTTITRPELEADQARQETTFTEMIYQMRDDLRNEIHQLDHRIHQLDHRMMAMERRIFFLIIAASAVIIGAMQLG